MASSRIHLGAWNYLQLKHVIPIDREGKIVAAKIIVYSGDNKEYFSFISQDIYFEIEKWVEYRKKCGENINKNSSVMRHLWDTKKGYFHHVTKKS